MPQLFLPIYFGQFDFQNHYITAWSDDLNKKRIVTGSINGDIIIWLIEDNLSMKPLIKCTPHLMFRVGGVTAIQIMKRPFSEFQDGNMNCVIVIHQDKRIRIYSMLDGKQLLISDHDQFPKTGQITSIYPVGDRTSRYIACFGEGTAFYIYDLWKMCCSKVFQINEEFDQPTFKIFQQIGLDFALIDSKFRVYKIDTSRYKKLERQNYLKYIEKKSQNKQANTEKKSLIRMTSQYSLKGLPTKKIINSIYNSKSQILYIVYSKQIIVVNQPFKESEHQREMFSIRSSKQIVKFRNVHIIRSDSKSFILIEQLNGYTSIINEQDIEEIIILITKSQGLYITLDFNGFSFSKQNQSNFGQLLLLLPQQLQQMQISKYFFQQTIFSNGTLFFRQNGSIIEVYSPNQFEQNYFRFCSTQQDNEFSMKLTSEGISLYLKQDSYFINEIKQLEIKELRIQFTDLLNFEQHNILDCLNQLPIDIQEQFKQVKNITKCAIALYNKMDLFAIFGTSQGIIYLIPFFYEQNKKWIMYINNDLQKPIIFLKFIKNSIFAVDESLKLNVYSLSSIFGKFDYQKTEFIPTCSIMLSANIKQSIKIRPLFQENNTTSFSQNDYIQVRRRLVKHLVAFQLIDDSLMIYHSNQNIKKYYFPNLFKFNQGQLKLYYLPHLLHFFIVKGVEIAIWTMERGAFQRIINISVLQNYINIEQILSNKVQNMINQHDFNTFASENISQFDIMEFSSRSFNNQYNYSQELKQQSSSYFYDFLGIINKIQSNNFEYDEILNILNYEDPSIYYRTKNLTIFEPQEMGQMFPLYQIYLKQFKIQIPFERKNKLYIEDINQLKNPITYFLLWFDCKKNVEQIKFSMENTASLKIPLTYVHFYQAQQIKPIFKCQFGLQGMGEGFSRLVESNNHTISGLMSTQYSIAAALCLKQVKSRFDISEIDYTPNLLSLSRFSLDESKDIIEISCQLISQQIKKMDSFCSDLIILSRTSKDILQLFEKNGSQNYYSLEIMCLIIQTYLMQQVTNNIEMNNYVFQRILQGFSHQMCIKKPNIVFVFIKLLEDGIKSFNKCIIQPRQCLLTLMQIYYYIYTTYKHYNFVKDFFNSPALKKQKEKEKYDVLKQYHYMNEIDLQRIKQRLRCLIIALSQYFLDDFKNVIKDMIISTDTYPVIPCSILDLLHYYAKQSLNLQEIQFILDLSIKTIDQHNPQLRRYTYKTYIKLITYMDLQYKTISYSQKKQKLAFAFEGIVQMYDLRYGIKLNPLDRYQSQITSIAFDQKGNQLASYSKKDQNLKIFQLKPTASFITSFENVFIKLTHQFNNIQSEDYQLEWDRDCQYLYLQINEQSQVFKVD